MNKPQLNEIKDRIYEAEGLLELIQLRSDKTRELAPMILKRIDEARSLMADYITTHSEGEEEHTSEDTCRPDDEDIPYASEEDEMYELPDTAADDDEEDEDEGEEDTVESGIAREAVPEETSEVREPAAELADPAVAVRPMDEPETRAAGPAVASESNPQEVHPTHAPAFCLNDRFRFRRTIFGGSQAEFNAAMSHLAALDTAEDAEHYFVMEMGLDPDDPDVADFLEIIKNSYAR